MWLVYVLLGLLLLVTALFFLPLDFSGEGGVAAGWWGRVELSWAGGILSGSWRKEPASPADFSLRLVGRSWPGKKIRFPFRANRLPSPKSQEEKRIEFN